MKIVILHGQDHKGSTYHVARKLAEKIKSENLQEFFFPRDLPYFCKGCCACIEDETKCPYYEQKKPILDAIDEADVLIVTTPTYCSHCSAAIKTFFELIFDRWMVHRPNKAMFRKRAAIVSTSAGSNPKCAMKDIAGMLGWLGVPEVHYCGFAVQAKNWDEVSEKKKAKIEKATDRVAQKLSKTGKPHVGLKTKGMFTIMKMMQKGGMGSSPVEKKYWEDNGWFGKARPWKS